MVECYIDQEGNDICNNGGVSKRVKNESEIKLFESLE